MNPIKKSGRGIIKVFLLIALVALGIYLLSVLATATYVAPVEPQITNIEPVSNLVSGDIINIKFNTKMPTDVLPLAFTLPGSGKWVNGVSYQFTIGQILPSQTYEVRLLKNSKSKKGGVVLSDQIIKLATARPLTASPVPTLGERDIQSPIEISFDQPVDHQSAEASFQISPAAPGKFSWKKNDLLFTPQKLDEETTYKISVAPAVVPLHGFPNAESSAFTFSIKPESFKLVVPYYHQQYQNSCESAALRMALAYYGIETDDMSIVQKAGYNPRQKDVANNVWDDPHQMFVGDINGLTRVSGYGVYGEPIAKAAEAFGRKATYLTSITPSLVAHEIKSGHPVVMWGYLSLREKPYTWNVPGGGTVKAFRGEHARTIVGVLGNESNPLGFYVHDPNKYGGEYEYWTAEKLMEQFNAVPEVTTQAVIVM